jgi:hypothetical protein
MTPWWLHNAPWAAAQQTYWGQVVASARVTTHPCIHTHICCLYHLLRTFCKLYMLPVSVTHAAAVAHMLALQPHTPALPVNPACVGQSSSCLRSNARSLTQPALGCVHTECTTVQGAAEVQYSWHLGLLSCRCCVCCCV